MRINSNDEAGPAETLQELHLVLLVGRRFPPGRRYVDDLNLLVSIPRPVPFAHDYAHGDSEPWHQHDCAQLLHNPQRRGAG